MSEQESRVEGILANDISNSKVNVLGKDQKVPQSRVEVLLSNIIGSIGGIAFKGTVVFASLPTTGMEQGDMYNVSDNFTTTSDFREGAGIFCAAGTNVVWDGEYWDIFTPVSNVFVRDVNLGYDESQPLPSDIFRMSSDTTKPGYAYSSTIPWNGVTDKDMIDGELISAVSRSAEPVNIGLVNIALETLSDNIKIYFSDMYRPDDRVYINVVRVTMRIWLTKVQEYSA